MNALDHYRKGEELLAQAQRKDAMAMEPSDVAPYTLMAAQAHFEAVRTLSAKFSEAGSRRGST